MRPTSVRLAARLGESQRPAPLNEYIDDPNVAMPGFDLKNLRPATDSFTFDGKVYAFPSEGDTAWMWYRKDLLEAKGSSLPRPGMSTWLPPRPEQPARRSTAR